jgi:hypothetical protein
MNSINPKNISQNLFLESNNIITKNNNSFSEVDIKSLKNFEVEENNPFIAKIEGKENIIINNKGNLKQIPINYLSGNIEKIKENTIFTQDNKNYLFVKDNKLNILVNIDDTNEFSDIKSISNIMLNDRPFVLKQNKLIPNDVKPTSSSTNLKEINLNKPVKIESNLGSGYLFTEPNTNKIKFISNKEIYNNNLLKKNESISISPNNYILTRNNDLVKFKLQDNILNKANELNTPKDILVHNKEQVIIPIKSFNQISTNISNKSILIDKKDILDNSKTIDRPFYVNHDDEKYLFINSKNGFKSLKVNDLTNNLQKIEQPIIFEKNNNIHIIKNNLSSIIFDKSIIDDNDIEENVNTNINLDSTSINNISKNNKLSLGKNTTNTNDDNISNQNNNSFNSIINIKDNNKYISKTISFNNFDEKDINNEHFNGSQNLNITDLNTKSYIDKNTLFFKDDENDFIVEIIPQKNFIKDSNKLSNISINGENYNLINHKLIPVNKSINNKIDINKPIKINSNLGEGLIYNDPLNGKLKFISNDDLKKNNINNLLYEITNNDNEFRVNNSSINSITNKEKINPDYSNLNNKYNDNESAENIILNDVKTQETTNIEVPELKYNKINTKENNQIISKDSHNNFDGESKIDGVLSEKNILENKLTSKSIIDTRSYIDKNTLYFKDNEDSFIVKIVPQKVFSKDINKLSSISINGNIYKPINHRLIPLDPSVNNKIDTNKPIKVNSNLGEGIVYSDPLDGKLKFISNNDLKINNELNISDKSLKIDNQTEVENQSINRDFKDNNTSKLYINKNESQNYIKKDTFSEVKTFEQNILFNNSIVSQISNQDNNINNKENNDTVDNINDENIVFSENKPKQLEEFIEKSSNKSVDKMSFDSLINSVLSGKEDNHKSIDGIKELNLFTKRGDENDKKVLINENINEFTPMITYGKDKKVLINENGQLKYIDINDKSLAKKIEKPILINHQGKNKLLSFKDKPFMIDIDKINTDNLYSDISKQNPRAENKFISKNLTMPQIETIKNDIFKTKEIIDSIVNNNILNYQNNEMSTQINKISMMYGALEKQVKTLKSELKDFKKSEEESMDSGVLESLLSISKPDSSKKTNVKRNANDKLPFETLLKSVLSEVYSKVDKISLNLQGREILSNNEKCFCIPLSIPIGELRFNGEVMVKQELDSRNKNKGKRTLNITLCVQTKTLNTVLIDITNLDKDLQISIKVENKDIKKIFDEKMDKINQILKNSSYNVKPVTCSINKNTGRGNSLLIPKDSFPKSLKRIDGII